MGNSDQLWRSTEVIRGEVPFGKYKFISIPVLGLKYLEDNEHCFQVPHEAKLSTIVKEPGLLKENLRQAVHLIEEANPFLQGAFQKFCFEELTDQTLFKYLLEMQSIDTTQQEFPEMIDELINRIQQQEGRLSGEVFTPPSINQLGVRLLNPVSGTFYDGASGISGTLREAEKYAASHHAHLELYGQEFNLDAWVLGKLLLLVSGKEDALVAYGDTLLEPAFVEGERVKQFDHVMMNFPLSLKSGRYEDLEHDIYHRFIYGIPPKTSADMAFVLHALASVKETGRAIVIVSNGTLFRTGNEKKIRKNMIAADVIEAVIALPENMFGGFNIQTNLLVLNKQKPQDREGKILFINAEEEFQQVRRQRYFSEENIAKITKVFNEGPTLDNFSKFVDNKDIKDADLLCKRYLEENQLDIEPFGKIKFSHESFEEMNIEKKALGTLASIYRGMNVTSKMQESEQHGYKVIKLSDVQTGEVLVNQLTSYSIKNNARIDSYKVQEGDVIVSSRGTTIKVAVIPQHEGDILLSSNFLGIRLGKSIDPYYLKAYLESPVGQFLLTSKQIGTAVATINPSDIKEIVVAVLDLEQQKTLGEAFIEVKASYERAIREAEKERQKESLRLYEEMGIRNTFKLL
ncbi:N-6 DNA methylase [Priestia megaterium]|uniref:site-specific DNA-methyltransferase (adenine-specific) n=1 Tax=Priestia megaterium TaxID=1404 RepID=A0AAE5PCB6_PRIMG|nr:N-6 DNA methylase [Priestia megaterium]PES40840.1 N-6 DNA methylase [Priestia megaterium]